MTKITILCDNRTLLLRPKRLLAEWGFSAIIETNKEAILFDTGQSDVALYNALTLKLPLNKVTSIVFSHGHYDHTGGAMDFFRVITPEKLYLHPDAWLPRYYKGSYIGIVFTKEMLSDEVEIIEHREPIEVAKGIFALGEIPRKYKDATLGTIIRDGKRQEDKIIDDQSLAIKTKEGIALLLGCCHSGLINTIEYAEEVVGDEVKFVLGGTHLIALKDNEVRETAEWLKKKVEFVAPTHCTGWKAEQILASVLKEKLNVIGAGSKIDF